MTESKGAHRVTVSLILTQHINVEDEENIQRDAQRLKEEMYGHLSYRDFKVTSVFLPDRVPDKPFWNLKGGIDD